MRANLIPPRLDRKTAVVYSLKVILLALAYHLAARLGPEMADIVFMEGRLPLLIEEVAHLIGIKLVEKGCVVEP